MNVLTRSLSKKLFRQTDRLLRKVQDGIFFDPKEYDGTSRGQKNDKWAQNWGELDVLPNFTYHQHFQ